MGSAAVRLDDFLPLYVQVGYGTLGCGGNLGYEGKRVIVRNQSYESALSTHPPARVAFDLQGRYGRFHCAVALNDDVPAGNSQADFVVLADGREVATALGVVAGMPPRHLVAEIGSTRRLELLVNTNSWENCHAVWLNPELEPQETSATTLLDCLSRTEITLEPTPPLVERCIATIASPRFASMLADLLGSTLANARCPNAVLVVLALDDDGTCARVGAKFGATIIPCHARARVTVATKSALYSIAHVVHARHFVCLDADTLVLDDLRPVFAALEACRQGTVLACREGNGDGFLNLGQALQAIYGGGDADIARLGGDPAAAGGYPLVVNDGVFAGSREALLALDGEIRNMRGAAEWVDERRDISWRNQFVFNLALAQLQCGVELDAAYNVQLHVQEAELRAEGMRVRATWNGRPARVLHFGGAGRHKYPEWRGLFARVPDPLVGATGSDSYEAFLTALWAWAGRQGLVGLAWSFYGTTDALSARVPDPARMPLFALLHYLIRSNGCVRVIESGTARGVSAACLASAVAHRELPRVVTLDPYEYPGRLELWASLPEAISCCIEARAVGALDGMATALALGERYDAALLDSLHTAEHVWAEFELAAQLVSPGGLILIHDPRWVHGTVEQALQRIQRAGYGVVRLWTADTGVREDDNLGLAVIENRRYG